MNGRDPLASWERANVAAFPKESDWRIFRKRVPEWRERFIDVQIRHIVRVLNEENATSTERFWKANDLMKEKARILVQCLDGHSRSRMVMYLGLMCGHGLVFESDLKEFSEELQRMVLGIPEASTES